MEDIDIGKMPDFVYIGHEFFSLQDVAEVWKVISIYICMMARHLWIAYALGL